MTFNSIQNYNNMPWLQPYMPTFNGGAGVGGWGSSIYSGWGGFAGSSSSSSSSSTDISNLSFEEYKKLKEKQSAEKAKIITEARATLAEVDPKIKELNTKIAQIEKGKQADGSSNYIEDFDKIKTGKKLGMAAMNMLDGVGNVCKSLIGFDKDGKWNPVKCIRNVAIAVGVGVLCVYAAPLGAAVAAKLGGGAVAVGIGQAIAATKVVLPAVGLASGTIMTGAGIYNTCKADTLDEFNKGTQQIGQGLFIGLSSAAGLRGISKSAGVAATGNGMWSNLGASVKNTFVNPWKAVGAEFSAAQNALNAPTLAGATAKTGFFNSVKTAKKGVDGLHYNVSNKAFTEAQTKACKTLNDKITEVKTKILNSSDAKDKAMLNTELKNLESQLNLVKNAKTRQQWIELGKKTDLKKEIDYKWYHKLGFGKNREYTIDGQKMTARELKPLLKNAKSDMSIVKTDVKAAMTSKMNQASRFATYDKTTAKDMGLSTKWYLAPYNWIKTKLGIGVTGMEIFGTALTITCPWYLLQPIVRNSCFQPINVMTAINPIYNPTLGDTLTAEECTAKLDEYNKALSELQPLKDAAKKALADA